MPRQVIGPATDKRPGSEAILLADGTIEALSGGHCAQGSVTQGGDGRVAGRQSVLLRVLPAVTCAELRACVVGNPCAAGGPRRSS